MDSTGPINDDAPLPRMIIQGRGHDMGLLPKPIASHCDCVDGAMPMVGKRWRLFRGGHAVGDVAPILTD